MVGYTNMWIRQTGVVLGLILPLLFSSCGSRKQQPADYTWLKHGIDVASSQLLYQSSLLNGTDKLPRSIYTSYDLAFLCSQLERDSSEVCKQVLPVKADKLGSLRCCDIYDWTSGFYPGSLWYAFELTGKQQLKDCAIRYTNLLNPVRHYSGNHDIGFMMGCSYGNAMRLSPNDTIRNVLLETADNLCSRFNKGIGLIRSWDFGPWNYPVIIDNMMNLELLFAASEISHQPRYRDVAIAHANMTLQQHFRPDATCWHVVSYNDDGTVEKKQTYQGKNDDSVWARGQAWAVYGYTLCFDKTADSKYLKQAVRVADMIMERVKTNDRIPYWDYLAPDSEETPRDASAAAITASAMIKLSTLAVSGEKYLDYAESILKSLSSDKYLAAVGSNAGFVLKHSTGSLPHGSEIDTPLNYADYYYLEAMLRYMNLKGLTYNKL